jgi:hypothetical protein
MGLPRFAIIKFRRTKNMAEEKTVPETTHRTEDLAHGIEHAFYAGGPGELPYFRPVMECMCGFATERCPSWEEAGRQLDSHLASVGAA